MFVAFYIIINYSGVGVAGLLRISGGANVLDFEFGFSYEKALNMLTALGTEGRAFYLTMLLPQDFPFPFVYMLCYAGAIALLLKHTTHRKLFEYLLILPVFTMLFDWVENIGIIAMLNNYPELPRWAAPLASISGMLKTVCTAGCVAVIVVLFILLLFAKAKARAKA
jgi:hypothetical protein